MRRGSSGSLVSCRLLSSPSPPPQAELLELDVDKYAARVRVEEGPLKGEVLEGVQYEDVCKVDWEWLEGR